MGCLGFLCRNSVVFVGAAFPDYILHLNISKTFKTKNSFLLFAKLLLHVGTFKWPKEWKSKTNISFFNPPSISLLNLITADDHQCCLVGSWSFTGFHHVLIFARLSVTSDSSVWESQKREKYLQNNYFVEI